MSLNDDHFKISNTTFLNDLNDIADDNAVGKYYTLVSGYQSSGFDIGESLIEKTCTIEADPSYDNKYTSNQTIKNTGQNNVSSSSSTSSSSTVGYIVGEQLSAISANGQYRLAVLRPTDLYQLTKLRISSDFGTTWYIPSTSYYGKGFRCVAMSANGVYAVAGTARTIDFYNSYYHSMYYNHNGDWSDYSKYSSTNTVWIKSTMNGTNNLNYNIYSNSTGGFRHVVLSASGKYGACTYSMSSQPTAGYVYYTSDYGVNWKQVTENDGPIVWWMSSSGQYCYGVRNSKLWRSSTYGETWEEAPGSLDCNRVTASSDGQYIIRYTIPTTANYLTYTIYRSDDYGITWTSVTNLAGDNLSISKISMSANGRYVVGSSYSRLIRSSDYGVTWINDSNHTWFNDKGYCSCSMSADGNHVINIIQYYYFGHIEKILGYENNSTITETKDLVEIYESKLKHSSVTDKGSGNFWSIGVSGNGEYILYGANSQSEPPIQLSTDRGNTWSSVANLNAYTVYGSISISYDGKYLLTGLSNNYARCGLSKDYGSTWQIYITSTNMGNIVGMSSDGKYMYTGLYNGASSSGVKEIQRSDDYGANWSGVASLKKTGGQLFNPTQIAISATGQYGIVVGKGCDIYKTSDYGVNWSPCGIGDKFRNTVAISKNGKYCVASEGSATNNSSCGIIYSSNYGANWSSSTTTNATFFAMSMSDSGQYAVANDDYNGIYISRDFGASFQKFSNSSALRKCAMTGKGDVIWTASTSKIQKHNMI